MIARAIYEPGLTRVLKWNRCIVLKNFAFFDMPFDGCNRHSDLPEFRNQKRRTHYIQIVSLFKVLEKDIHTCRMVQNRTERGLQYSGNNHMPLEESTWCQTRFNFKSLHRPHVWLAGFPVPSPSLLSSLKSGRTVLCFNKSLFTRMYRAYADRLPADRMSVEIISSTMPLIRVSKELTWYSAPNECS